MIEVITNNGVSSQILTVSTKRLRAYSPVIGILRMDRVLKLVLPERSSFIYRKAPNFGNNVVRKITDPPLKTSFWPGLYSLWEV